MRAIAKTLYKMWLIGVLYASLTAVVLSQKVGAQPPPTFPAGFEKLASEILISPDSAEEIRDANGGTPLWKTAALVPAMSGLWDRSLDCNKLYRASELWLKETDPTKKLYAKTCLQGKIYQFYNSVGSRNLLNFPNVDRKQFYRRMMDVLAGGELDKSEIHAKPRGKKTILQAIHQLKTELDTEPGVFRRNNEGDVVFASGEGDGNFTSLAIEITPLTTDKFQVFTCKGGNNPEKATWCGFHNHDLGEEFGLCGFLFGKDGEVLASIEDGDALTGCFDAEGRALLVSESKCSEQVCPDKALCLLRVMSPEGKTAWSKSIEFGLSGMQLESRHWSVSPALNQSNWILEMWDSYRGWAEIAYACWELEQGKVPKFKKLKDTRMENSDENQENLNPLTSLISELIPIDKAFRYARSTYFHSMDSNGGNGFAIWCARRCVGPLCMEGYESPVRLSYNEKLYEGEDSRFLCLPRTDEASPLRNSWPTSRNFFVSSECYEPVFGSFLRARQGVECDAETIANSADERVKLFGEPATFFSDPSGDLKGWSMGYVAGDAEDGKSLLVTRTSGQLLTISPEYKVAAVRTFVTPDGKEAKPLLMLDSHHAGVFLVGKSIVVGTWKPPLLQRLFSSSGKKPSKDSRN